MFDFPWRRWVNRQSRPSRGGSPTAERRRPGFKPRLETLEDRTLPAVSANFAETLVRTSAPVAEQTFPDVGVAANGDSVRRLMDARRQNRERLLRIEDDEDREMSVYLTPVQRAQFQMLRSRFLERVNELRQQRQGRGRPGVMGRPRAGGGMRPRAAPQQRPRRRP